MEVLRVAILDFCRRKKGKSFSPSEVIQQMFPEDWALFLDEIHSEMLLMHKEGQIHVTQNGKPLEPDENTQGSYKIVGRVKPK
ncbi:DUF3253 domain-containing protein [Algoriphagus sp. A40]|uniref:DUF3253 domain-containing protein n=1 Tax=Algoriphagus sp. A40 TaxID=1945863 RepID=UPI0009854ACD|nr:DUF3253 domain-containing protein [Algoriphagus sp. A40]OOG77714.1 hypothetical protein B0E43_03970 [Algoriphagus sp. A40]